VYVLFARTGSVVPSGSTVSVVTASIARSARAVTLTTASMPDAIASAGAHTTVEPTMGHRAVVSVKARDPSPAGEEGLGDPPADHAVATRQHHVRKVGIAHGILHSVQDKP